jgi:hypothetical protein
MEYDREFTEQLYVSTGLKYDVEEVWIPMPRGTSSSQDKANLDAARKTLE